MSLNSPAHWGRMFRFLYYSNCHNIYWLFGFCCCCSFVLSFMWKFSKVLGAEPHLIRAWTFWRLKQVWILLRQAFYDRVGRQRQMLPPPKPGLSMGAVRVGISFLLGRAAGLSSFSLSGLNCYLLVGKDKDTSLLLVPWLYWNFSECGGG